MTGPGYLFTTATMRDYDGCIPVPGIPGETASGDAGRESSSWGRTDAHPNRPVM